MSNILIGVTGGIAAYKVASVVSVLHSSGHNIRVVMTNAATKFVGPLTFSALSHNPVFLDDFTNDGHIWHIELADWADIFVIAPLTFNTAFKIATGVADNLLTSIFAAIHEPTIPLFFPAMNTHMYENLIKMMSTRVTHSMNWIEPEVGRMACGAEGIGKLPSVKKIVDEINKVISKTNT